MFGIFEKFNSSAQAKGPVTMTRKIVKNLLAEPPLLDKIDKLFACNVGEHVDLPQLVVVGDQSSGKSSVLEGLTGLPFPRDSELCTRFATQIVFRRSLFRSISASIIPDPTSSDEHIAKVKGFSRDGLENLDSETFAAIMREVQDVMGVSGPRNKKRAKTFTRDILRLELSGPDEEHLTVIDVPGIFKLVQEGQTTIADREMVREMVTDYMRNARSLMLAVIPSNVDTATQEILQMAKEYDPDGNRTLGILTKPDLVDKGAENSLIELLQGKRYKLKLGWHVVRNPGQQQITASESGIDRHALEVEFFEKQAPWNTLGEDKHGIPALRIHLQRLLAQHIRQEFPKVKREIDKKLNDCKKQLNDLGTERETTEAQRLFLTELSTTFQRHVDSALEARYSNDIFFDKSASAKLATEVVSRNDVFSSSVAIYGHTYEFNPPKGQSVRQRMKDTPPDISTRTIENNSKLGGIVESPSGIQAPKTEDILEWIGEIHKKSRGFELGNYNNALLTQTMRKQSVKWDSLAHGYISDVVTLVDNFIEHLLEHICPNDRVRAGLKSLLDDQLTERYQKAIEHVKFILQVERDGIPITVNKDFYEDIEKSRSGRIQKELHKIGYTLDNCSQEVVSMMSVLKLNSIIGTDHITQQIHDSLQSYYNVARQRFVDNICMQAAAHYLVTGHQTPLKLFTPSFVTGMSDNQLEEVAGEDFHIRRKRDALRKEISELEAGRKILN